jgi:hypothetical protein
MMSREDRESELRELFKIVTSTPIGATLDEVIQDLADDWELRRSDAEEYGD